MKKAFGGSMRLLLAVVLVSTCACTVLRRPAYEGPALKLIAVMPLERVSRTGQPRVLELEVDAAGLPLGTEGLITAQIYGVMAESSRWRFVPDLTVDAAVAGLPAGPLERRALALGKALGADGVLYGTVYRFVEREGGDLGSRKPASVSFRLALLAVDPEKTIWTAEFNQTQEALSSNLFRWWQFWRAGPRWFSARELARLGVEQLLDDLRRFLG